MEINECIPCLVSPTDMLPLPVHHELVPGERRHSSLRKQAGHQTSAKTHDCLRPGRDDVFGEFITSALTAAALH